MDEELRKYIAENPERWERYLAQAATTAVLELNGAKGFQLCTAESLAEYIFDLACAMMEEHRTRLGPPAEVVPFPKKAS